MALENKAISELLPYEGRINGDQILIISTKDETNNYVSRKYEVQSLAEDVSSSTFSAVSSEVSNFLSSTYKDISSTTDFLSSRLSNALSTLSCYEKQLCGDISNYVDITINPLRNIVGLSTLDHYTFVGTQTEMNEFLEQKRRAGSLSAAQKVIWMDTTKDERFHPLETLKRMDNLQVQIYRLGLQLRDVHKILENGVIPGEAYNDTKDEMIEFADKVLPPDESILDGELLEMSLYGNYFCKNGQLYYLMFNPSGFLPKGNKFNWIIKNHDAGAFGQKTLSCVNGLNGYYLKVNLDYKVLSSIGQVTYSGAISPVGTVPSYTTDQELINEVIETLSADNKNTMSFYVSSDYYDKDFKDYIVSEEFDVAFRKEVAPVVNPGISVYGNDYIDKSALYYAVVDETKVEKFPLNIDTNWYFLAPSVVNEEQVFVKSDSFLRKFQKEDKSWGQVTFQLQHFEGTPICQVSVELSNCIEKECKEISAKLYVESNYDNSISASKDILGIGGEKPETLNIEPTVKAVCAKYDEKANLIEKMKTLYPGEVVFFSDTHQLAVYDGEKFYSLNSTESSGLSKDEIQNIGLEYLTFSPSEKSSVLNRVETTSDGKLHVVQKNKYDSASDYDKDGSWEVYVNHLLQIGKIYCGGKAKTYKEVVDSKVEPEALVSHNYVELVNASDEDINLDKIYLMYHTSDAAYKTDRAQSGDSDWEFLRLTGVIKAHGTYLIRGAECNPCQNAVLKISECDAEWRKRTKDDEDVLNGSYKDFSRSGDLIEFSPNYGSFHLCYATKNADQSTSGNNVRDIARGGNVLANANGYIDLIGLGANCAYYEGDKGQFKSPRTTFEKVLIQKWYYMDPAKQGNKKPIADSRKNSAMMTAIDLTKQQVIYRGDAARTHRDVLYYSDAQKFASKPGTTNNNDGIFAGRTHFTASRPNMLNITFGIQATHDEQQSRLASRCFNWISKGYYDEYVEVRKQGTSNWKRFYSITPENSESWIQPFHQFYDRIRWTASDGELVTTHKCIIRNHFTKGVWEYRVGRENDETYTSGTKTFKVHSNTEASKFSFIQTSDQQGFNWIEYQAWKASCKAIKMFEDDFNFTINTGDIAQSGNRVSEWLDYYDGRQYFEDKEEMFTIGNNDLCGSPSYVLGDGEDNSSKFNLINILYYYTFELDQDNQAFATYGSKRYPLYSLYSFNYGPWHFISLVSEIRSHYARAFDGLTDSEKTAFAKALNSDVERWFRADLINYMTQTSSSDCSKCIVFMHEMPFTMVTADFFDLTDYGAQGRAVWDGTGSRLNTENGRGDYRFSRLFKKFGIRLIIGGHKHTFTLSNPLYDAPAESIIPASDISYSNADKDSFISSVVDEALSHKPVIELPMKGTSEFVLDKLSTEISVQLSAVNPTLMASFNSYGSKLAADATSRNETKFRTDFYEMTGLARLNQITAFNNIDDQSERLNSFLRTRFVDKITAPTYSMSQATGYKVVSNKELPAATSDTTGTCRYTPWLLSYCAALNSTKNTKKKWESTKNPTQCRPTYIRYDLDAASAISVQLKQVDGIYNVKADDGSYAGYKLDSQTTVLSCNPITFGHFGKELNAVDQVKKLGKYWIPTMLDDYLYIYRDYIKDDTYIIKL